MAALLCALTLLACGFSGCTVATRVSLSEPTPGRGDLTVAVTLDRSALSAVGGLQALRSQISLHDLTASGWVVTGPTRSPGGGAVLTVRHPFGSDSEADRLLSDVAGNGVFRLALTSHRTFWRTSYRLAGKVDLSCGVACFGDAALKSATGSPVGVDPAALAARSGQPASSVLRFALEARLPGAAHAPGATRTAGGALQWTPALGRTVQVFATSSTLNRGRVAAVAAGAGAALVAVAAYAWLILARRRRPGRAAAGQEDPPSAAPPPGGEAVTPPL